MWKWRRLEFNWFSNKLLYKLIIVNQTPCKTTLHIHVFNRGCHGRDRMVVGFTTTYAISAL